MYDDDLFMTILRSINFDANETDDKRCIPPHYPPTEKYINFETGWIINLQEMYLNEHLQLYISFLPSTNVFFELY